MPRVLLCIEERLGSSDVGRPDIWYALKCRPGVECKTVRWTDIVRIETILQKMEEKKKIIETYYGKNQLAGANVRIQ